jgi:dihydrofolate synthase/folylpolyglutamate synthase
MALTDYASVQDYLFGLKAKGIKFGIDRMRLLAAELGHPELRVPIIHIAGTNGKGSTAAMVESILRAAGKRVGLYTSPHLVRLGERVQVDRAQLTETEIVDFTRELDRVAERVGKTGDDNCPSFFEFMTAMAFLQFERKHCDVGVVEVGLGGELDATNIVKPIVTAITSIGLDHCEMLGYTLAEIAQAKAGIMKPGIPVVMGRLPEEAEVVVRRRADELNCPVFSIRETFGEALDGYPESALEGDFQQWNAATATLIARALPSAWAVDQAAIDQGLAAASWPARWQRLNVGGHSYILDSSHNPEGAAALACNLTQLVSYEGKNPVIVVGVLGSARAGALLKVVARFAHEIHLVIPNQARACSHAQLRSLIPTDFQGNVIDSSVSALFGRSSHQRVFDSDRTVVITGSIYLAGEVMGYIYPSLGSEEGHLQDF